MFGKKKRPKKTSQPTLVLPVPETMDDAVLRSCGFRIHSRPHPRIAYWMKNGQVYSQGIAEEMARRQLVETPPNEPA